MIDPLATWKDELENLPKTSDTSWALNFANWYADRITNIEPNSSALTATGFVFTFPTAVFASQLQTSTPTLDPITGISNFASAWETAILATTVVVGPGSYVGTQSPPTIFSAVTETIIDPASVAAGKAKIMELVTASPTDNAQDSEFPEKFRDATLLLSITVTGLNSVSPPGGPNPLVASNIPLT